MKKFLLFIFLLPGALNTFAFTLSPEAKQEAALFNTFLQATYALREEDPKAFLYLQKALQADPDSKYLKRLLVSSALANGTPEECVAYAKRLCDELGKEGGFIFSEGKMLSYRNDANRENYKAVCDFVSSYRL